MKLIEPISAIVSWEDYDYQGHIALYYSLKLIHDFIMSKTEISDFVLQIESIEDFAICKDNQYTVRTPAAQFNQRQDIIRGVKWEDYIDLQGEFKKLDGLNR